MYDSDTGGYSQEDFHLTTSRPDPVLWERGRVMKIGTDQRRTALRRACSRARLSWRKVATGVAGLLTVAMGYHVVFGQNGLTAYQQKRHDSQELTRQASALTGENLRLQGHVNRLKTDPDAIEHQAREELHYTRAGEVIYSLPSNH